MKSHADDVASFPAIYLLIILSASMFVLWFQVQPATLLLVKSCGSLSSLPHPTAATSWKRTIVPGSAANSGVPVRPPPTLRATRLGIGDQGSRSLTNRSSIRVIVVVTPHLSEVAVRNLDKTSLEGIVCSLQLTSHNAALE